MQDDHPGPDPTSSELSKQDTVNASCCCCFMKLLWKFDGTLRLSGLCNHASGVALVALQLLLACLRVLVYQSRQQWWE